MTDVIPLKTEVEHCIARLKDNKYGMPKADVIAVLERVQEHLKREEETNKISNEICKPVDNTWHAGRERMETYD